jgi:hypothetical protein
MSRLKVPVHVEADLFPSCNLVLNDFISALKQALSEQVPVFANGQIAVPKSLQENIQSLYVTDLTLNQHISFWQADLCIHVIRYSEQGPDVDYLEGEEEIAAAEQWELPNMYLRGLWESIIVDQEIKLQLINYCCSSILFADAKVDPNIISWNKMILLYGPPGTLSIACYPYKASTSCKRHA